VLRTGRGGLSPLNGLDQRGVNETALLTDAEPNLSLEGGCMCAANFGVTGNNRHVSRFVPSQVRKPAATSNRIRHSGTASTWSNQVAPFGVLSQIDDRLSNTESNAISELAFRPAPSQSQAKPKLAVTRRRP